MATQLVITEQTIAKVLCGAQHLEQIDGFNELV